MKIKIGKYRSWFGVYQLAELLQHVGVSDDKCYEIGEWLGETWVNTFLTWVDSLKKRHVSVKIDKYDTWSMDHTLSFIILPMLIQLRNTKHGSSFVDDEDVPEELRSTSAPKVNLENGETDDNFFKRWDWVMDEMIHSFTQIKDAEWEEKFHTGSNGTRVFDKEGYMKENERIENGLCLFGKYFTGLWD